MKRDENGKRKVSPIDLDLAYSCNFFRIYVEETLQSLALTKTLPAQSFLETILPLTTHQSDQYHHAASLAFYFQFALSALPIGKFYEKQ